MLRYHCFRPRILCCRFWLCHLFLADVGCSLHLLSSASAMCGWLSQRLASRSPEAYLGHRQRHFLDDMIFWHGNCSSRSLLGRRRCYSYPCRCWGPLHQPWSFDFSVVPQTHGAQWCSSWKSSRFGIHSDPFETSYSPWGGFLASPLWILQSLTRYLEGRTW